MRAFVPFYTTKPEGSGIGLVLSRQIAEAHAGSLELRNRAEKPACIVRILLPLNSNRKLRIQIHDRFPDRFGDPQSWGHGVPGVEIDEDPESTYLFAGHLSYCGQTEKALRFLQSAVDANYCSYPAMDIDPMLANIRGNPKFREIREAGITCQKKFDAQRGAAFQ